MGTDDERGDFSEAAEDPAGPARGAACADHDEAADSADDTPRPSGEPQIPGGDEKRMVDEPAGGSSRDQSEAYGTGD